MSLTTRTLRIAFVLPDLRGGGAQRVSLQIARGLMARGHDVDLVLFDPSCHFPAELHPAARLFVLDNDPDDMTRERAPDILDRCIPQLPERQDDAVNLSHTL